MREIRRSEREGGGASDQQRVGLRETTREREEETRVRETSREGEKKRVSERENE